jgi:hypothetical protein
MAILQAILTALLRQAGKLLNTVFGWATTMLFGKVPEKRQIYLSVIGLGSVLWIVVLLGIAFPRFGAFLLAFIPLPENFPTWWVRLAMLGLAVLIPPLVGFVSLFLLDPEKRPKGSDRVRAILKGYPTTLGLALTLIMMLLIIPVLKLRDVIRGWTSNHIPVVVQANDYFSVLDDVRKALGGGGIEAVRRRADWMLRVPTKVFTLFAGSGMDDLVAAELSVLRGEDLEVLLHPCDLVIRGKEKQVARAHALITEHLAFTKAYLTWTKEAQAVEDRLGALWRKVKAGGEDFDRDAALAELDGVEKDLRKLNISSEEWGVLLREKLQVERALLRAASGLASTPEEAEGPSGKETQSALAPAKR